MVATRLITDSGPIGDMGWHLVSSWVHSGNVAQVDFKDLAGYSDIQLLMRNVVCSHAEQRLVQLSVDNGATFYGANGDYVSIDAAGVETATGFAGFAMHDTGAQAARSALLQIAAMNVSGAPKFGDRQVRYTSNRVIFVGSLLPVNAIRCKPQTQGTFDGGTIFLLGRKAF